jgi:tripartite ATP-independent transporter DctP family solute receptor
MLHAIIKTTCLLVASAAWLANPASAEKLRIAGNFPAKHSSTLAMNQFADDVKAATNGEITVDVFPAMQLGGPQENVDQVLSGTIFLTWLGTGYLTKHVPALEAVNVPFLFKDRETAFRVIDGTVGEEFKKLLMPKGFMPLGYMELGFRNVTNNVRPIRRLEDFKGLKLRSVPSETHLATFRALGANASPMDWKEVYSALQQGVMDGQENPWPIILDARLFEVQKYVSNTRHLYDFIIIVANKRQYDGLKPNHRAAIDSALKKAVAYQRVAAREADDGALTQLQANKMQFDRIPDSELERIRQAISGVVEDVRRRAGPKIMDLVLTEAGKSS